MPRHLLYTHARCPVRTKNANEKSENKWNVGGVSSLERHVREGERDREGKNDDAQRRVRNVGTSESKESECGGKLCLRKLIQH